MKEGRDIKKEPITYGKYPQKSTQDYKLNHMWMKNIRGPQLDALPIPAMSWIGISPHDNQHLDERTKNTVDMTMVYIKNNQQKSVYYSL